jgi:hypothetical protein
LLLLQAVLVEPSFADCTVSAQLQKCNLTAPVWLTLTAKGSQVGTFTSIVDVRGDDAIHTDKANITISDLPRKTCGE